MDIITKAIALKTTDYGESDKFILLYSLDYGKISVHAKGIRKAKAKLKFAGDTFCFGNYEIAQTGDRLVLKTCEQLESFYTLREDIVAYYSACAIAECLVNYTEEGQSEPQLFVETLRALEQLVLGTNPLTVVLRYLLGFVKLQGFALDFKHCAECGDFRKKMFLDFQKGGVVCDDHRTVDSLPLSAGVVSACNLLTDMPFDKLKTVTFSGELLKDALATTSKYIAHSFAPNKSLAELLHLA